MVDLNFELLILSYLAEISFVLRFRKNGENSHFEHLWVLVSVLLDTETSRIVRPIDWWRGCELYFFQFNENVLFVFSENLQT